MLMKRQILSKQEWLLNWLFVVPRVLYPLIIQSFKRTSSKMTSGIATTWNSYLLSGLISGCPGAFLQHLSPQHLQDVTSVQAHVHQLQKNQLFAQLYIILSLQFSLHALAEKGKHHLKDLQEYCLRQKYFFFFINVVLQLVENY